MSHQRKHVKQEALNADEGSLPGEGEAILRVVRLCGSNLLEVRHWHRATTCAWGRARCKNGTRSWQIPL